MKSTCITFTLLIALYGLLFGQAPYEKKYFLPAATSPHRKSADKAEPMYNSLMNAYDVKFYKLNLEADNTSIHLKGDVTIIATVVSTQLDTFVVELNPDYTIDSILINGSKVTYVTHSDDIKIHLATPIAAGNIVEAQVFYHGSLSAASQGFFSGISYDAGRDITYTLSEPLYAKDWFPCKQVLTDKADSVYVFITTNSGLKAGSNGLLTNTVNLGGGKVRYEWKSKYPIAYYLISMTIGDYVEYNLYAHPEGMEDSILIQNYVYDQSVINNYKDDIDMTADLIEAYSALYGPYPFSDEKYGHCQAPIGGGMEHQTMTTLSDFSYDLVAHELSHMWFGDNVTCGTWQDIWINEGFATYSPFLATEYLTGEFPVEEMRDYHEDQFYAESFGSIYIPEEEFDIDYDDASLVNDLSWRIFNWYLSYEKGAVIIHMIRYELNDDELFFNVLKTYQEQYRDSTAIGLDFKELLEDMSGKDFSYFFDQWYFGEGYPRYQISWFQANDTLYIQSRQGKSTVQTPFFRMNMDYQLTFTDGDTIMRLEQTQQTEIFRIPCSDLVISLDVDPYHWVLAEILSVTHEYFLGIGCDPIENNICLYPNPVTNKLTIRTIQHSNPYYITLYDLSGQLAGSFTIDNKDVEIDLSYLKTGIYIATIITGSEQMQYKLIKQ